MRHSNDWTPATVRRVTALSPTVREIELEPDGGALSWTPGSHLQVRVRLGEGQAARIDTRHYSLVGRPDGRGYRIAVKRTDASRGGSRFMSGLQPGDRIELLPPSNHFELPAGQAPTLLLAGGIGITPLVGMAQTLVERGAPLRMAYAARSAAELVYAAELRECLGECLALFASDAGQRIDLGAEIAALPADAQLLVCGPLPLMQAAQAAWAAAGRPAAQLRFETFGAGGAVPAQAFVARLPRHGLEIEVPADRSLLEVLEANGIEMLSDCRRGECGLCAIDVVAVEAGEIDHRDVFLDTHQRSAGRQLCACVSRLCGPGATVVLDSAYRPDASPPVN